MLSAPSRHNTSTPADGSRTLTFHPLPAHSDEDSAVPLQGTLRLRGGPRSRPRVAWDERVIDNENCGRKKSKICCIYHKPKPFDESSDESSDDDSESDAGDDGRARPPHRHHGHDHEHRLPDDYGSEGGLQGGSAGSSGHNPEDANDVNAYEDKPKKGKHRANAGQLAEIDSNRSP